MWLFAGPFFGKARALSDENGNKLKVAGPATPVSILGLGETPNAGDKFRVAKDEKASKGNSELPFRKA